MGDESVGTNIEADEKIYCEDCSLHIDAEIWETHLKNRHPREYDPETFDLNDYIDRSGGDEDNEEDVDFGARATCRSCGETFETLQERDEHVRESLTCTLEEGQEARTPDSTDLIKPVTHGLEAKTAFDHETLDAYFGLVSAVYDLSDEYPEHKSESGKSQTIDVDGDITFEAVGREFKITAVKYWSSQLDPSDIDRIDYDRVNEYSIQCTEVDGQADISLVLRPSWEKMESLDGESIVPNAETPRGLRVQINSSYLEPDEVLSAARAVAKAVDFNPKYLRKKDIRSDLSTWTQIERHVRIKREYSDRIVGLDGKLTELSKFYASKDESVGEYKWDNQDVLGRMTHLSLGEEDLSDMVDVAYPANIKHYHLKNPRHSVQDPIDQPKVEVQIKGDSIPWEKIDEARADADTILTNTLRWSGIPVNPTSTVYVDDDEFTVTAMKSDGVEFYVDPCDEIEDAQEETAVGVVGVADEIELEALEEIVNRHGSASVGEVAEALDRSVRSVYRYVSDRLSAVVDLDQGELSISSDYLFDRLDDLLEKGASVSSDISQQLRSERAAAASDSALERWATRWGIEGNLKRDDELTVHQERMTRSEAKELLRSAYSVLGARRGYDEVLSITFRFADDPDDYLTFGKSGERTQLVIQNDDYRITSDLRPR
ncbi:MAG: hypothetical protein SV253_01950 [Halobacteria archaeon]|nr:hypothetical protein [Halobacteria archaeon]